MLFGHGRGEQSKQFAESEECREGRLEENDCLSNYRCEVVANELVCVWAYLYFLEKTHLTCFISVF